MCLVFLNFLGFCYAKRNGGARFIRAHSEAKLEMLIQEDQFSGKPPFILASPLQFPPSTARLSPFLLPDNDTAVMIYPERVMLEKAHPQ